MELWLKGSGTSDDRLAKRWCERFDVDNFGTHPSFLTPQAGRREPLRPTAIARAR